MHAGPPLGWASPACWVGKSAARNKVNTGWVGNSAQGYTEVRMERSEHYQIPSQRDYIDWVPILCTIGKRVDSNNIMNTDYLNQRGREGRHYGCITISYKGEVSVALRVTAFWGSCIWRIWMYQKLMYATDTHLTKVWMRESSIPQDAAVVVTPIRKLCHCIASNWFLLLWGPGHLLSAGPQVDCVSGVCHPGIEIGGIIGQITLPASHSDSR